MDPLLLTELSFSWLIINLMSLVYPFLVKFLPNTCFFSVVMSFSSWLYWFFSASSKLLTIWVFILTLFLDLFLGVPTSDWDVWRAIVYWLALFLTLITGVFSMLLPSSIRSSYSPMGSSLPTFISLCATRSSFIPVPTAAVFLVNFSFLFCFESNFLFFWFCVCFM